MKRLLAIAPLLLLGAAQHKDLYAEIAQDANREIQKPGETSAATVVDEKKQAVVPSQGKKVDASVTTEDRLAAAAQGLAFSSLCIGSAYLVYRFVGEAGRLLKWDPYLCIPNPKQEYLDKAWWQSYVEKPVRIGGLLCSTAVIFGAHYKFAFYKKVWDNFRLLFKK